MNTIKELEKFKGVTDKFQSNYTIIVNDLTVQEVLDILFKKLEFINKIKDNVRRKYLNDRLYTLVEHFKQLNPEDKDRTLYLVGKQLEIIPLKKSWISMLNSWNVENFIFRNDECFDIDYLNSLLIDDSYFDVIKINNKSLSHIHLNPNKKRVFMNEDVGKEFDLEEFISKNTKNKCLVHGVSSIIKNFKGPDNILVFNKHMSDESILDEFKKDEMRGVHATIEELFGHMQNEKMMHRVKIGKDIKKAIQYGTLETLYCIPKVATNVREKVPGDLQNFTVIEVHSLEKGDTADVLESNYNGAIGFTYY